MQFRSVIPLLAFALATVCCPAQDTHITIQADQAVHQISRYLTGACIEDVNHEVYGGMDSQMIFGERIYVEKKLPTTGSAWQRL
jgi:hypothetical protein